MKLHNIIGVSLVVAVLLAVAVSASAKEMKIHGIRLPDPVEKTFKAKFIGAEITKCEIENENGVTKYAFEFIEGGKHKDVDIAADGTLMELTTRVDATEVPAAVMGAIQKSAAGGTILRIERDEIGYETKDGKVIPLPKPLTQYVALIARGEKKAEVTIAADGAIVEPAWWDVSNTGAASGAGNNADKNQIAK